MSPDEYCHDLASKSGSSFYYSFLFLPDLQRRAITALYAFCREVDDVVDECSDSKLARVKLQWWRDEIGRTFKEQPSHPVGQALLPMLKHFNLPQEHFLEIIDGMEMDLDQTRYADFKQLSLYCYRVASVVGLMAAEIFGYHNRNTLKYAHKLGMAFQLTNILRDVREDASRGRIYLPQDELARFGVAEADILQGRNSDAMKQLMSFQVQRAQDYYQQAFSLLPEEDRYSQRSGLIMASIYRAILDKVRQDSDKVLQQRISITPIRKLWLAWRSARQEKKRHKRFLASQHA